ncbi:MAG: hypothetical protein HC915_04205 [Anaerolineae bacterium]|nr:hypothetical protein [Anaerolineae bacterium]
MSIHGLWSRVLYLGLGVLLIAAPLARAQVPPLPPETELTHLAVSPGGRVVAFYPEGWALTLNEAGFSLVAPDLGPSGVVQLDFRIQPGTFDPALPWPDWLMTLADVPAGSVFTPVNYGNAEGWIAQGAGWQSPQTFEGLALLPLNPAEWVTIHIAFPETDLPRVAPVITAVLENLVLLPGVVEDGRGLRVNLPLDWRIAPGESLLLAAASEDDLARRLAGQFSNLSVSFRQTERKTLREPGLQEEVLAFQINENPAFALLSIDPLRGTGLLEVEQQIGPGQVAVMQALAANPETLQENLPLLLSLAASMRTVT